MGGTDGTTKVRIHALGTAPTECGEQYSGLYKGEVRQEVKDDCVGRTFLSDAFDPNSSDPDHRPVLHLRQLFFKQLLVIEIAVVAVQRQQLIMGAELDDPAAVQHGNSIGIADS